jgi:hypothetical protein
LTVWLHHKIGHENPDQKCAGLFVEDKLVDFSIQECFQFLSSIELPGKRKKTETIKLIFQLFITGIVLTKPHDFVGLVYQGKDIVFRFIIEYSNLMDFGPWVNRCTFI